LCYRAQSIVTRMKGSPSYLSQVAMGFKVGFQRRAA
jgi:hypothetical protein